MRNNALAFWGVTAALFVIVATSGRQDFLGAILGYWLGFLNTAWLRRETLRSVDLDIYQSVARMRRNFFARLGVITIFVVAVGRWERAWLPDLAFGIAGGLLVSMIFYIRRQFVKGKG